MVVLVLCWWPSGPGWFLLGLVWVAGFCLGWAALVPDPLKKVLGPWPFLKKKTENKMKKMATLAVNSLVVDLPQSVLVPTTPNMLHKLVQ